MIEIAFKRKDQKLVGFKVEGHAEYIEDGVTVYDDVVCGVVSNLAQVTILGVTEVLNLDAPYTAEEGYITLDIGNLDCRDIDACRVLMETMLLGLTNLELSYGTYINVLVEEVQ